MTTLRQPSRTVLAGILLGVGLALLVGDTDRTSSPSFATARMLWPIDVWGTLAVVLGALLLSADELARALRVRLAPVVVSTALAAAAWFTFWCCSFIQSALRDDRAALTGIPVYGGLALLALAVARGEG